MWAAFHKSLAFGDVGMRLMTQKKKTNEINPVAKVEPMRQKRVEALGRTLRSDRLRPDN